MNNKDEWTIETEFLNTSQITPTRNKDAVINATLLNPHYTDTRFQHERSIFIATNQCLVDRYGHATVQGASYIYSDRLYGWYSPSQLDGARQTAHDSGALYGTASYFEVFLQALLDQPQLELVHIIAGVNRSTGYSYLVYGYIIKEV